MSKRTAQEFREASPTLGRQDGVADGAAVGTRTGDDAVVRTASNGIGHAPE
jgi:hypothetical protein